MEERRLREAALKGNVPSLIELLQNDPLILDREIVDCVAKTTLHIAAMLGHVDFARELINHKPELAREFDQRRQYPLHLASAKGYVEIVKLLLSIGSDICLARDRDGKTPLHLAAMRGEVQVLEELDRVRPDAKWERVDRGQTILYLCVKHDRSEALKLLLDKINDNGFVNLKDDDGNTVLHFAVAEKQIEAIMFLLSRPGLDLNSLNVNGLTALDVLMQSPRDLKDIDIGEALRNAGALRSRDLAPATSRTGTSSTQSMAEQNGVTEQTLSLQESSSESYLTRHEDWMVKKRETLMLVATVIATMSFQAGSSPPGGVWQDDVPSDDNTIGHNVGSSTMNEKYPQFVGANTAAFVASLSIILLLMSGLPMNYL